MDKKRLILLIIFIIALVPRLYKLDSRSTWMDEGKQALLANVAPVDFILAKRAAKQQQPPLDYFFESIGIRNFGLNETGMRVHAAIAGALAAVFFLLLLQQIIRRQWVVLLGTILFIFHPDLIRYSQEGRPIATAVLFSVLLLYTLTLFFQGKTQPRPLLQWLILLTLVQTGFILSTGFQPLVFLGAVSISLIPILLSKPDRKRVYLMWISTVLAFFTVLPIIKLTLESGANMNYVKHESFFQMILGISKGFSQFSIRDVFSIYPTALGDYEVLFTAAVAGAAAGFFLNRRKKANRSPFAFGLSFFLLLFIIYPPVFTIIFNSLISWYIKPRYFLTFVPVVLVVLVYLVDYSISTASELSLRYNRLKLKPVSIAAAVLLLGYSFISTGISIKSVYAAKNPEWNKIYHIFKYDSQPGSVAYMVNLVAPGKFSPVFRANFLYYHKSEPRPVLLKHARDLADDIKQMRKKKYLPPVYLVFCNGWKRIKSSFFKRIKNVDVFRFYNLAMIRIRSGSTKKTGTCNTLVRVLRILKRKLPQKKENYIISHILSTI